MTEPQTLRKLRLGAFIMATGHHIAAWRHPGSQADAGVNIDHYIELAQTAERGLFDQELVPEELTQVRMATIVKTRYPELDEEDQEAVRQHAIAALTLTQQAKKQTDEIGRAHV